MKDWYRKAPCSPDFSGEQAIASQVPPQSLSSLLVLCGGDLKGTKPLPLKAWLTNLNGVSLPRPGEVGGGNSCWVTVQGRQRALEGYLPAQRRNLGGYSLPSPKIQRAQQDACCQFSTPHPHL